MKLFISLYLAANVARDPNMYVYYSFTLTLVNAGYFFEEITQGGAQSSAPLKFNLKIDFANFVFSGA